MEVKALVPLHPFLNLTVLMGGVVVQDQMNLQPVGHLAVDRVEELDELGVAVPGQALADHGPSQHVQGGEQGGRAVALVVMGPWCLPVPAPSAVMPGCGPKPESATSRPYTTRWPARADSDTTRPHRSVFPQTTDRWTP